MMNMEDLETTARALVAKGKGILAADESHPTIQKRFAALNIESTEENRRAYREMLFTAPGIEEYISGVILFDETIRQKAVDGRTFVDVLNSRGIIPGIKVDKGTIAMPGSPDEKITAGLDGLRERLKEYREMGARFAKWRAVITIGPGLPTRSNINANAHSLAQYAALAQEAGLVPIVEPEVLMDGAHDIERCEEATLTTLAEVFQQLGTYHVALKGMLLKPNMVIAGKKSLKQAGVAQVAEATLRTLRRTVPGAVPGIVFLSGGQSPELATEHLNTLNALGAQPWEISFSFGRALQEPSLKAWQGSGTNVALAQRLLLYRAERNGLARLGRYSEEMERAA